jgi:hypothetical protein
MRLSAEGKEGEKDLEERGSESEQNKRTIIRLFIQYSSSSIFIIITAHIFYSFLFY